MANKKLLIALGISTAISLSGCNGLEIEEFNAFEEQVVNVYGPAPITTESETDTERTSETDIECETQTDTESTSETSIESETGIESEEECDKTSTYNDKDDNTLETEFSLEDDVKSSHKMYGVKQLY